MRELYPIIICGIKNNLRKKASTSIFIALTVMIAVGMTLIFCVVAIDPQLEQAHPEQSDLVMYLGLIMYTVGIIGMGINLNVFAFHSMTREKAGGNIESLLASPLKAIHILLAKSLAVFLPGLVLGTALSAIALSHKLYIFCAGVWFPCESLDSCEQLCSCTAYLFISRLSGAPSRVDQQTGQR